MKTTLQRCLTTAVSSSGNTQLTSIFNKLLYLLPGADHIRRSLLVAACLILLPAWAHADQLFATVNGTGQNGGGVIFQYNPSGMQSTALTNLDRPRGLAFDKNNNLFVTTTTATPTHFQGSLWKITPNGQVSAFADAFPQDFFLQGIAIDRHGNVFVVASDLNDANQASTIFLITPDGTLSTFGSTPGQTFDAAFDKAGNLFVADTFDQIIFKFTPAGVRTVVVGPTAFNAVQAPIGLAFDKSGTLFVSTIGNPGNDSILKFTPAGAASTFVTGLPGIPRGLAFRANGDLFVAEVGNAAPGDILRITPRGAIHLFSSGLGRPIGNGGAEFLAFK